MRTRVLNFVADDRFGGPQKRVIEVAERLKALGFDTVLVLPDRGGNTAGLAQSRGLEVCRVRQSRIPNPRNVLRLALAPVLFWRDVRRIMRLLRRERPAIVHVNGGLFMSPAIAAGLAGIPVVWHLNDTHLPRAFAKLVGSIVKRVATVIVVAADVVASHYALEDTPYELVYAPVDADKFGLSEGENCGVNFRIGLIGNYNPLKGHIYFLQALAIVREQLDDIKGVLVGARLSTHEKYAAHIDATVAALGLGPMLEERGFVPAIEEVLRTLDVLVLSSIAEACPIVVLEAMAAGLPVVATDVGGVKELLLERDPSPAGVVVPPRDAQAIADALLQLHRQPRVAGGMGEKGRQRVKRYFSLENCVALHAKVYAAAIANTRSQSRPVQAGRPRTSAP